ncbi:hypothetical protein C8Q80DRAFT_160878 [Daedaleopsis nitida]|nr:hypothetical protein C8Q80DRAFT_160878 [Daedaleopsis nitida]
MHCRLRTFILIATITMLHHIPLELAEDIIDHLADDHTSLLACALTSPKWLTRCRIHLFGTLRISSLEQLYNLHGVLLSNPAFGHIVQAIVVVYGTVKRRLMHDQWAVRPRTALDSAAVLLLPHLPRLRSWSYESAGPHSQNPLRGSRATLACHQQYLAVCELRLIQVSFACTADLARLLLALPALRSLHLSNVDVAQDSPQVMLSWCILRLRQSFQLTTLWCSKVSTRAVLLLDHAVASSVQNLTITTDDHGEF